MMCFLERPVPNETRTETPIALCNGIQGILGLWIPDSRYWIRIFFLSVELGFRVSIVCGTPDSLN